MCGGCITHSICAFSIMGTDAVNNNVAMNLVQVVMRKITETVSVFYVERDLGIDKFTFSGHDKDVIVGFFGERTEECCRCQR